MESVYDELAKGLVNQLDQRGNQRITICIAGIAGSGKSTLAHRVADQINKNMGCTKDEPIALVVGMDGYHLPKSALDKMPDPKEAHARRGAPFTFDPERLVELIRGIVEKPGERHLAPSFDHAIGDPVPDDVQIKPTHRVVLVEGLYLLLKAPPWNQIAPLCDESWYIDCSLEESGRRVAKRHVQTGLAKDLEGGKSRWESNDRLNALIVIKESMPATRTIKSVSTDEDVR